MEEARKDGTDLSYIRFGDNDTPQLQPIQVRPTASPRQLAKQTPRPRSGTSAVGGASALSSAPSLASAAGGAGSHEATATSSEDNSKRGAASVTAANDRIATMQPHDDLSLAGSYQAPVRANTCVRAPRPFSATGLVPGEVSWGTPRPAIVRVLAHVSLLTSPSSATTRFAQSHTRAPSLACPLASSPHRLLRKTRRWRRTRAKRARSWPT